MDENSITKDFTFNLLVLHHLNRISKLSSAVAGEVNVGNQLGYTVNKEEDKVQSFGWLVKILEAFIPEELEDKPLKDEIKHIPFDKKDEFSYFCKKLHAYINLLARKGLLLEQKGFAKGMKKGSKPEEVFE